MAFFDQTLLFSNAQAITTTADATNLYDITGAGSGNAPAMIGGNGGVIGMDIGSGDGEAIPYVYLEVGVAGTGAGTITVTLSTAPDNGSNVAGSYTQLYQSAAFVGTTLTKGSVLLFQVPPRLQIGAFGEVLPRFYKLSYTVSGSATATVTAGIIINPPTSLTGTLYPENFISV